MITINLTLNQIAFFSGLGGSLGLINSIMIAWIVLGRTTKEDSK